MDLNSKPWKSIAATGPILRTELAAEYLGISKQRYYSLAAEGALPTPLKIGTRASGLPRPWLDAIIAERASRGGGV